jgi:hypothetical protein
MKPTDEGGCLCEVCGCIYKVDIMIPTALWKRITTSTEKLLCGSCIATRIEMLAEFGAYKLEEIK